MTSDANSSLQKAMGVILPMFFGRGVGLWKSIRASHSYLRLAKLYVARRSLPSTTIRQLHSVRPMRLCCLPCRRGSVKHHDHRLKCPTISLAFSFSRTRWVLLLDSCWHWPISWWQSCVERVSSSQYSSTCCRSRRFSFHARSSLLR